MPDLDAAHERWTDEFLQESFRQTPRNYWRIERSNHGGNFLYYSLRGGRPRDFHEPQSPINTMSYDEFLREAQSAQSGQPTDGLLYLTVSAHAGAMVDWIRRDLKFLLPSDEERAPGTGLVGDPFFDIDRHTSFHGINCRLGMRGILQASHYDGKRNFIAM